MGSYLAGLKLWMLRQSYLHEALFNARNASVLQYYADRGQEIPGCIFSPIGEPPPTPERIAQMRRMAAYCSRQHEKYERAARYPWLSVPRDPPPPE